jgi:hypothetical protein
MLDSLTSGAAIAGKGLDAIRLVVLWRNGPDLYSVVYTGGLCWLYAGFDINVTNLRRSRLSHKGAAEGDRRERGVTRAPRPQKHPGAAFGSAGTSPTRKILKAVSGFPSAPK